jgi:amino acid adenylation domain-containing protein
MVDDTQPKVILTQSKFDSTISALNVPTLSFDQLLPELQKNSETLTDPDLNSSDIAYVIYTSGSTGKPKGVMNTHAGVCNRIQWMQDEYKLSAGDNILQKTPYTFDVSVWEFFWPIMAGASIVVATPEGHKDSHYLAQIIHDKKITVLHFVPSMLRLFLDEQNLAQSSNTLRHVICSGEALLPDLRDRYFSKLDARLHNLYGPTEAAIDVTYWECTKDSGETAVPIGHPVANTNIYILDKNLKPVADGEEGEIHIGGIQLAAGYLNQPELTAKKFIPNPFDASHESRLYKTGDLGCKRKDGAFEFIGRMDFQVKLRGIRTELSEIEIHIEKSPAVKQAILAVRETKLGDQKLIAYLTLHSNAEFSTSRIRAHIEKTLPEHMVPSVFMVLDSFPLTPSGKVDRKALPAPSRERPSLGQPFAPPRNALETYLAQLWHDILEIDEIGINDRFFELGGTSLQAAEFVGILQKHLDEFIYVLTIFDAPTIAEYAAFLQKDYPAAIENKFAISNTVEQTDSKPSDTKLNNTDIELMESCIVKLGEPLASDSSTKNPQAIFILAPPRSGTTLLRVMLAGHPKLFAAAELQLLGFQTLQQRNTAYSGKYKLWLEGTIRAIMEIKSCSAEQATEIMAEYEKTDLSTKDLFAEIQSWIGDNILVDKSPSYGLDYLSLEKAENDFDSPIYIHLLRHPYAMIKSFTRYHMDQVLYLSKQPFSAQKLGELVWYITHRNIVKFFHTLPDNRKFRVRFEEMVLSPDAVMQELCQTFNLEYTEQLVNPYNDIENKMIDGLHDVSIPMGDTNLLAHKAINPKVAESWKGVNNDNFISPITWKLATQLGYPQPDIVTNNTDKQSANSANSRREKLLNRRRRK